MRYRGMLTFLGVLGTLPVYHLPASAQVAGTGQERPSSAAGEDNPDLTCQRITAYVDYYAAKEKFNGAVLVAKNGSLLFHKAYGRALGPGRNPSEHSVILNMLTTPQAIFSLTKSFTAVAILQLQDRGLLRVQDPVSKYLPDWPTEWQTVTLHQLLTQVRSPAHAARAWTAKRRTRIASFDISRS